MMTMNKTTLLPRARFDALKTELQKRQVEYRDCGDTIIVPKRQRNYLVEDTTNGGLSPGMAAYIEIRRNIKREAINNWSRADTDMLRMRPPQLFTGPRGPGWLGYIDIKSCFYQLYQHLYWNLDWPYHYPSLPMHGLFDALSDWKEARNSVVGIARSLTETWVKGHEVRKVAKRNPYLSPAVWWSIQSILADVAREMINRFSALYVCVDCYVFSDQARFSQAALWFMDRGISIHTHQSPRGQIYGWQSLHIGQKETQLKQKSSKFIYHLEGTGDAGFLDWWLANKEKNGNGKL